MELSFDSGRFVSLDGDLNYREVLDDFQTAKTIRIITYNISKNQRYDALLDALKNTDADVQLITNVPSRMDKYYDTNAGHNMRSTARKNINIYISKLNPENFPGQFVGLMSGIPEVEDIQKSQLYKELVEDCGESEFITTTVKSFRYGEGESEDATAEDRDWLKSHPEFLKSDAAHICRPIASTSSIPIRECR